MYDDPRRLPTASEFLMMSDEDQHLVALAKGLLRKVAAKAARPFDPRTWDYDFSEWMTLTVEQQDAVIAAAKAREAAETARPRYADGDHYRGYSERDHLFCDCGWDHARGQTRKRLR